MQWSSTGRQARPRLNATLEPGRNVEGTEMVVQVLLHPILSAGHHRGAVVPHGLSATEKSAEIDQRLKASDILNITFPRAQCSCQSNYQGVSCAPSPALWCKQFENTKKHSGPATKRGWSCAVGKSRSNQAMKPTWHACISALSCEGGSGGKGEGGQASVPRGLLLRSTTTQRKRK